MESQLVNPNSDATFTLKALTLITFQLCSFFYSRGMACQVTTPHCTSRDRIRLIDFKVISTRLGLFYANRLGNHVHCTFISTFLFSFIKGIFTRFYRKSMISKHIYLSHGWDPNRYYHPGSKWTLE